MNYCTLCGRKVQEGTGYHRGCLNSLFGVSYWPKIDFTLNEISIKAQEMAGKLSISGVQAKLSLRLNRAKKELDVAADGGEYILKPQINTFMNIPQNENLCMNIAFNLGIEVSPHSLIRLADNSWAYIVKRFDRVNGEKLHQEDFCQILNKKDKYSGSFEEIGNKLREFSEVPGLDTQLFFERVLFFFLIGNGDAHLKNFSVIYNKRGRIRLSPAYDVVSSKLVMPDEEDFALTINGKRSKITTEDFEQFARTLGIRSRVSYKNILGKIGLVNDFIEYSQLNVDEKIRLSEIIKERVSRLKKAGMDTY